jgi:hypothetical protein
MMKIFLLFIVLIFGFLFYYYSNYIYYKIPDEEMLFLNPLESSKEEFDQNYNLAINLFAKSDTSQAKYYCDEALKFKNSFNECQFLNIGSDSKDYYLNSDNFEFKYSNCYKILGRIDSSNACLSRVSRHFNFNYISDDRFKSIKLLKKSTNL